MARGERPHQSFLSSSFGGAMWSSIAASITVCCVRMEYPAQSGRRIFPKRGPRIRGPDTETKVIDVAPGIAFLPTVLRASNRFRAIAPT